MPKDVRFDVGTNIRRDVGWIDSDLRIINFGDFLTLEEGAVVDSPCFWCFEQKWKVQLRISENLDVGLFLIHIPGSKKYKSQGEFTFYLAAHDYSSCDAFSIGYDESVSFGHASICNKSYMGISTILSVSLEMVLHEHNRITNLHGQDYKLRRSLCNALSDTGTSDISFDVKGQIIQAHLVILKAMAPDLVRTLNLDEHDASNPVPISDVEPDIFQTMLEFIYGGTVSFSEQSEANNYAKAIIDASDKYGIDSLKISAEESYVNSIDLTTDNVVDILLYADGNNCDMLRDKAMEYLMGNMEEVAVSPYFARLYQSESITKEIMISQAKRIKRGY